MVSVLVNEKMKTNNYLVTVTSPDILELKVKEINFLFPIENYSVGFINTYKIDEIISQNAYIYLNRILDCKDLSRLEKDLENIPKNIEGICFTDMGVLYLVKKLGLDLKLIYMQNHNTTNVLSINFYLEEVDSVLVSTDITYEEIVNILNDANKPLVVPYFMKVDVMYSRRKLLSNFQSEFDLENNNQVVISEPISNNVFLGIENEWGTYFYDDKFIDYREINEKNILFKFINPLGLNKCDVEKIINGEDICKSTHKGFLDKKTYYKLTGDTNE